MGLASNQVPTQVVILCVLATININPVCTRTHDQHDRELGLRQVSDHRRPIGYSHAPNGLRSRVHSRLYRTGRGPTALALRNNNKYPRDLGTLQNKPTKDTEDMLLTDDLLKLKKSDPIHALLEYVKKARALKVKCNGSLTLDAFNYDFPNASYERFRAQAQGIVKTANVLNNMFRVWDADAGTHTLYNDAFYFSLVRAIVESDETIYGSSIAFDRGQYDGRDFCPYVHRNKSNEKSNDKIIVKDLAIVSKHQYNINGTKGYEWFWKHRDKNYSELLWKHRGVCNRTTATAHERISGMMVLSTSALGRWTRPYYDCSGGQTWMVTYSVPFFGCTKDKELFFK